MRRFVERTAVFLAICLLLWLAACTVAPGETAVLTGSSQAVSAPDLVTYPWVYLRDDAPLAADEPVVTLLAVGDVMLGRGVLAEPEPLVDAASWLGAADLTWGNLEGVVTDNSQRIMDNEERITDNGSRITLAMPVMAVSQLREAGFDLVGLANNHSLDLGADGLAETAVHVEEGGLEVIGVTKTDEITPVIRVVNNARLAFLAFNAVPDPEGDERCRPDGQLFCPVIWDEETAVLAIKRAKEQADAVIVSIHWGLEYEVQPAPMQERIAKTLRTAGADLVLGHHPHVAQPIETDAGRVVAYSLGNFVFDQETAVTRQGLALLAYFDTDGLRAVQALPVRSGLKPRLITVFEAESWLDSLLPPPPRLGFVCTEESCQPAEALPLTEDSRFFSGQIDLTGDGYPETVRREGERITIYEAGTATSTGTVQAVWQSPKAWQVVDAALGDPNDDGRYEIMLAIWQKDEAGYERSQPYMVGYRGGSYTLMWGGRPVVDPIQELALADVDGDAIDELVVIIEQADGQTQSVAVWQWQGWTFSLQWQSDPGWYEGLAIEDEGERPFITVYEKNH